MRRLALGCVLACASIALLGGTASAAHTKSISLIAEQVGHGHGDRNGFVFHEKLYNHGKHVGRDRIRVTGTGPRSAHVSALFRFHQGKIRVAGPLQRGKRQTLPVVGGSGRFSGASGQIYVKDKGHGVEREIFHLTR